jgi:hypothetical protein
MELDIACLLLGPVAAWVAVWSWVGVAWWVVATIGCVTAVWIYKGSGHEILLDREAEAEHLLSGAGEIISMERINSSVSATQHNTGLDAKIIFLYHFQNIFQNICFKIIYLSIHKRRGVYPSHHQSCHAHLNNAFLLISHHA